MRRPSTDQRPRSSAGHAAGERLETLDHVERELTADDLVVADPAGALGIAGIMGGAASEVSRRDDRGDHRVGHLRPGRDPPDRASATPCDRRPACASRRARSSGLARIGADRVAGLIAAWAGATRRARPGRQRGPTNPNPARLAFRPDPDQPPARHDASSPPSSARPSPGPGSSHDPRRRRRATSRSRSSGEPQPLSVPSQRRRTRSWPSIPTLAGGPRDRERPGRGGRPGRRLRVDPADPAGHRNADVLESPLRRPEPGPRDARRGRADRGGHGRPGLARGWSRCSGSAGPPARRGRRRRSGRPDGPFGRSTRSRPITRSCARACSAACSRSSTPTLHQGRDDIADLRGRQGLRLSTRRPARPRMVAARVRPDRREPADGLEPAAAAVAGRRRQGPGRAPRPTRLGFDPPTWSPLTDEPVFHPGRSASGLSQSASTGARTGRISARESASCIRDSRPSSTFEPSGSWSPRSPCVAWAVGAAPRDQGRADPAVPGRRAGPGWSLSAGTGRPPRSNARSARPAVELLRSVRLFDVYRGAPLWRRRAEPGLAAGLPGRGPHPHRCGDRWRQPGRDRRRPDRRASAVASEAGSRLGRAPSAALRSGVVWVVEAGVGRC